MHGYIICTANKSVERGKSNGKCQRPLNCPILLLALFSAENRGRIHREAQSIHAKPVPPSPPVPFLPHPASGPLLPCFLTGCPDLFLEERSACRGGIPHKPVTTGSAFIYVSKLL